MEPYGSGIEKYFRSCVGEYSLLFRPTVLSTFRFLQVICCLKDQYGEWVWWDLICPPPYDNLGKSCLWIYAIMHWSSRRYWLYISYERCFLLGCGLFPVETLALENPVFDHPALGGVLLSTFNQPRIWLASFTYHVIRTQGIHLLFVLSYAMDCKSLLDTTLWIYLIVWDSLLLLRRCGLPGATLLAPLVLYSTVDHTNSRESNYPMELRCLM